jgi:Spy/CpxP family protein refolding chaperone
MRKLLVVSVLAALTGSVFAIGAAAAPDNSPPPAAGDMRAFMLDARLAGMKAALNLTPEQAKNWAPFETAVRDAARARADDLRAMRQQMRDQHPDPIQRMTMISDRLGKASTQLKSVADAAKPLFDSLDDTQKHHFGPLLMSLRERGPGGRPMMEDDQRRGPDQEP